MFKNDRYLTRGINENISFSLQMMMWQLIEEAREITQLDYLQVFTLEKEPSGMIHITHHQEQPEYRKEIHVLCDSSIKDIVKIFVIDDGDHSTMLLAEEY